MSFLRAIAAILIVASPVFARARASSYCTQGGQVAITNTIPSATKIQQSYPQCSIQVFYSGGAQGYVTTSANIVTFSSGIPFNANSGWPGLTITLTISGTPTPFTIQSVTSAFVLVLTASAGTNATPIAYSMPATAPAAIFSNNTGTALANPFVSSTTGYWGFFADNGTYDISASGGGIPAPITWSAVSVIDPFSLPLFISSRTYIKQGLTFYQACASAAAQGLTLVIDQTWYAIPTSGTCAATVQGGGGLIQPASGQTVTMGKFVAASGQQIFDVSAGGSTILSVNSAPRIYPDWWGADPSNNSMTATATQLAWVTAIAASEVSTIPIGCNGTYNIGTVGLTIINSLSSATGVTLAGGIAGCTLVYTGSGWPLSLGVSSVDTYNYSITGLEIDSSGGSGNGIMQLRTINTLLSNVRVEGATTQGVCHLIDGYASQSIFTRTENLWCNHTFIGQQFQSTGGFNNVTTVDNYSFHAFNSYPAPASGSIGVYVVGGNPGGGNGDGIRYFGGDLESLDIGVSIAGASGSGGHNLTFSAERCENNNTDIKLSAGSFANVFEGSPSCGGTTMSPGSLVTDNSIFDPPGYLGAPGSDYASYGPTYSNQFIGNRLIPFSIGSMTMDAANHIGFLGGIATTWGPYVGSTPEGNLAACLGSLVSWTSGDQSTTLYVKESGACTSAGWGAVPTQKQSTGYTVLEGNVFNTTIATSAGNAMVQVDSNGQILAPTTFPAYANNAAATGAGLVAGDIYSVSGANPRTLAVVY